MRTEIYAGRAVLTSEQDVPIRGFYRHVFDTVVGEKC